MLDEVLQPKILCKDITQTSAFWIDRQGTLVPRHSVYYIVPKDANLLDELCAYLNSGPAAEWLNSHCQRAANGFLRIQSNVMKRLPLPPALARAATTGSLFNYVQSRAPSAFRATRSEFGR